MVKLSTILFSFMEFSMNLPFSSIWGGDIKDLFKTYDFVVGPTAMSTAYDVDSPMDDPLQTFMDDALVFPANLAGLPGLNVPVGLSEDNMPIGMHIIGNDFEEAKMYQLASFIEQKLNLDLIPGGEK